MILYKHWLNMEYNGGESVFDVFQYDKNTMDDGQWTTTKLWMIFHFGFWIITTVIIIIIEERSLDI